MERSEIINLRVTPEEKAALVRRAEEEGVTASEFLRRAIRPAGPPPVKAAPPGSKEEFDKRVNALRRTMPTHNARIMALREGLKPG